MDALSDTGLHVGSARSQSPVANRAPRQPRMVEGSARAGLGVEQQGRMLTPSEAVLQMVRRSAEEFAEIVETLGDARTASIMTGLAAGVATGKGNEVDVYA